MNCVQCGNVPCKGQCGYCRGCAGGGDYCSAECADADQGVK